MIFGPNFRKNQLCLCNIYAPYNFLSHFDYIQDEKIKNVANLLTFLLSIIIPLVTVILLLYKF